jgi:hypothetical protein
MAHVYIGNLYSIWSLLILEFAAGGYFHNSIFWVAKVSLYNEIQSV